MISGLTPEELGLLDSEREREIRSFATGRVLTLHSCGVALDDDADGVVALLGVSGSGKTTLGLACAQAGMMHLGDEYGFVDLDTGEYWHEEYPISVKEGSSLLAHLGCRGEEMISPFGVRSYAFPRSELIRSLGGVCGCASKRRPLRAFVAVNYSADAQASLEPLSVARWPEVLLPSIDGSLSRRELFDSLVELVPKFGIRVCRLSYSVSEDALMLMRGLGSYS